MKISEAQVEAGVTAALKAEITPGIDGCEGPCIDDYLEFVKPRDAIDLGVTLLEKDKDGAPRYHWHSDIRCDELDDVRRAILRPVVRAALEAATALSSPIEGEMDRLREALKRQGDNMAFLLNHTIVPGQWFEKFDRELEEDRSALDAAGDGQQ